MNIGATIGCEECEGNEVTISLPIGPGGGEDGALKILSADAGPVKSFGKALYDSERSVRAADGVCTEVRAGGYGVAPPRGG